MAAITLTNKTALGESLKAIFLPEKGMNLISLMLDDVEVIDQTTMNLFEERYAGLGALIGPHFHHRKPALIPAVKEEQLFPHIARVNAKGINEPFSHGIARYAPWNAVVTENVVKASLSGKDLWNGISLAELEGQNFKMELRIELLNTGLQIDLSVVSDADSLVGIHYYYYLPNGKGVVSSSVQKQYVENGEKKEVASTWEIGSGQEVSISLEGSLDHRFFPFPNPIEGKITLDTDLYRLTTTYHSPSQENCWQLYHPKESSFVCIEPMSAQDPNHPNLTVSSLRIHLNIEKGNRNAIETL